MLISLYLSFSIYNILSNDRSSIINSNPATAVVQSVRALALHAKGGCSNPSCDRPISFKQVVTAPLLRSKCHRSSKMTIINGCPMSQ